MKNAAHLPLSSNAPGDFDFFVGSWQVRHKRLKQRLAGCTEWEEFAGMSVVHKILGGFGNVDDNLLELPGGAYRALTVRSFDPANKTWSIWWLDGRHPDRLDVPVVGSFENGVGMFLAKDKLDGKDILVRFRWTQPVAKRPMWEQAFSPDGGRTWETNWIMEFSPAS